jgi:hypothetical protein
LIFHRGKLSIRGGLNPRVNDGLTGQPTIMSTSRGLSDEQVSNELKRMVAFIKQEALEKSREIHIKVFPRPQTT